MKQLVLIICLLSLGNLASAQSAPSLGSAQSFAVLGATTVTNTGATVITGDLGVSPGTAVTGFPPGTISGGTIHSNDAAAVSAHADAQTTYNFLTAETCGTDLTGKILGTDSGAVTLAPGVYCFSSSAQLTGTLTLSGSGIYVFKLGTTLTTASASKVVLTNGATAGNVFWKVGTSATLGTDTVFVGSIFANVSDTITGGSSVTGQIVALTGAVTLDTNPITVPPSALGRWEIVHTSGDNPTQAAMYPGGFSIFLRSDGTGYTYGSIAFANCVIDSEHTNIVPTWVALGGNSFQITITVDNLGSGPNFSFIYTGTYDTNTSVPGDPAYHITAITGTYSSLGVVSACSLTTDTTLGEFVATFLPTLTSGSATGSLDAVSADNGSPFDAAVSTTFSFSTPPAPGQIAGTVSFATNPTFNSIPCFAAPDGVLPLTINSTLSYQSGIYETIYAEGVDPNDNPTTLSLIGYSANVYTETINTDPYANQVGTNQWAAAAAIAEDFPAIGVTGVDNDGTNNAMVYFYSVVGGACNGAGGVDAPFHFLSGTPNVHRRRHKISEDPGPKREPKHEPVRAPKLRARKSV